MSVFSALLISSGELVLILNSSIISLTTFNSSNVPTEVMFVCEGVANLPVIVANLGKHQPVSYQNQIR